MLDPAQPIIEDFAVEAQRVARLATAVRDELIHLAAADPASPLHGASTRELTVGQGRVVRARDPRQGMAFAEIPRRARRDAVEFVKNSMPPGWTERDRQESFGSLTRIQTAASGSHSIHA